MWSRSLGLAVAFLLARAAALWALPAPAPLQFGAPTPAADALVTTGTVSVRLNAACSFDPGTLAVSLAGTPIPAAQFLPFSACANGRMTSQTATVALALPNGTIAGGPASLTAGAAGNFTGGGTGDGLRWNFDGAAAPASGAAVTRTFDAAGIFTVRLQATQSRQLAASGLAAGNLVTADRAFLAGDPTPDARQLTVAMPPDVDFVNHEAAHVHPLALSAGGTELYAVDTPEARLSVFSVAGDGSLAFAGAVPVGLDPVSLAVRPGTSQVWVANHLSDSVTIVDAATRAVVDTLAVGDEPTDVAFASGKAFVALAGNEDRVRVYNAATRALTTTIDVAGDDPRALAVNAAGTQVYAIVLRSGNRTTVVPEPLVTSHGGPPAPNPPRNPALATAPKVGLIVQFNPANSRWEDETGGNWTTSVAYTLPDDDVFVIGASAATPTVTGTVKRVGTTLFDLAVHPVTGQLWVSNTDARNVVRFEPKLRGHLVETRVSRVTPASGTVSHVDLDSHINYAVTPGPPSETALSLALPGNGVFRSDGALYYLAAFGSAKVAVLDGTSGAVTARIAVGGGPSGVALNELAGRLYVMNRFDHTISIVDTAAEAAIGTVGVAGAGAFDPSPDVIKAGRPFLYDAASTSGHGDVACATCHPFADLDMLAWNLGNPPGVLVPYASAPWAVFDPIAASTPGFDPMKGPMTTQTLRGLDGLEPFHWRGDRQNFQHFNQAFVSLLGRGAELTSAEMDAYADFIMTVRFPPNPFRNLDDTLPASLTVPSKAGGGATTTGNPAAGANTFSNVSTDGPFTCALCHALPTGTTTHLIGLLGFEDQDLKIPHLRNMYEKVGFATIRLGIQSANPANAGLAAQKSGFGFVHDGTQSLVEFLAVPQFTLNDTQERDLFAFMIAFPTETVPAVGRQVAVTAANKNAGGTISTIATLLAQANASRCDVIAKGTLGGTAKGWVWDRTVAAFVPDSLLEQPIGESALRASVAGGDVVIYTGVPLGSGMRLGIDQDRDGWLDRTELALGMDPADPHRNPWQWGQ
jgi:YVTN family beta-propeller protein